MRIHHQITKFISFLGLVFYCVLVHCCQATSSVAKVTTYYYSDFNEFALNGVMCLSSKEAVKMVLQEDTVIIYIPNAPHIKFEKKGGAFYRKVCFHMENWGRTPCKHDWDYPRCYHCHTRNDTIIELMQEYSQKELIISEIYLKTRGSNTIRVARIKKHMQSCDFDQLLDVWRKYQLKKKLTSHQIASQENTEGSYSVSYSIRDGKQAIYTNSYTPSDTLFIRELTYPYYIGLNCGVFEDEYMPSITEAKTNSKVQNISTFIQSKLNKSDVSSTDVSSNRRRAIVEVFVSEKGDVAEVKIVRGIHPDIDAEIIRACKELPPFSPKIIDNKKVNSSIVFPVFLPE